MGDSPSLPPLNLRTGFFTQEHLSASCFAVIRTCGWLGLLLLATPVLAGEADADPTAATAVTAPAKATAPANGEPVPAPQTAAANEADALVLPGELTVLAPADRASVIGLGPARLRQVPGAVSVLDREDLAMQAPRSVNEALARLPGVHARDEEGLGLRPNIGIRGLNPNRSSKLLVLEDGVPIALAPYGEPEMYYNPPIERMAMIELIRGSGSILYGPQTVGGVLNYITAEPPEDLQRSAEIQVGSDGYWLGQAAVGDTAGQIGYRLSAMHQRYESPRQLNLRVTDVMGKLRLQLSDDSSTGIKLSVYDEGSNSTYLGLTTAQFESNPRVSYADNDRLNVRRYAASVNHDWRPVPDFVLQTLVYGNNATRDWRRQDFDRSPADGRVYERIIDGEGRELGPNDDLPADGSAIYFRNGTGNRNRAFTVAGVEPRATWFWAAGDWGGELVAGTRLHFEEARERRFDGSNASAPSGEVRDDEQRRGRAAAAYAQHRFSWRERLHLSPGLRLEHFEHERKIWRTRVNGTPTDVHRHNEDRVTALIPGFGATFDLMDELTLFSGVHRGFAPPRTKDAVDAAGDILELDAEYSWNYELGLRGGYGLWLQGEVAGFVLDFENQVIAPTEAGGAVANDPLLGGRGLVNSGDSRHLGVESSLTVDPAGGADWGFRLPLTVNYTYVDARFGDGWAGGIAGNVLPYSPFYQVSGQLRFVHPLGLSAQLNLNHVGRQYADNAASVDASADGTNGAIDAYTTVDARIGYRHEGTGIGGFVAGKNLADQPYIASRAPSGIMPAGFRQWIAGVQAEF